MKTLIINSNNLVSNSFNDTYTYKFPVGAVMFKNDQVALSQINMYYSWPNISSSTTGSQYNNNSFAYYWIDGSYNTITLPDGYYDLPEINAYMQSVMVSNGHYLISDTGSFIYFLELIINQSYYAIQLDSFLVPTSSEASALAYSQPSNATWSYPTTSACPQLVVLSTNNFYQIIGFTAGTYPTSQSQTTSYSVISTSTPQITPVASIILECSLLNNVYSIPSTLLYSFAPNVAYGEQIAVNVPTHSWVDIQDGQYNDFTITFKDQNLNRVNILDTNIIILLTIKNKNEYSLGKN